MKRRASAQAQAADASFTPPPTSKRKRLASPSFSRNFSGLGLVILIMLVWEAGVRISGTPVYLLPAPTAVLGYLVSHWLNLAAAGLVTLAEAAAGLIIGTVLGLCLAVLINFHRQLEQGIMSVALMVKSTPIIAIAPILTIWLGFGPGPKIIITALLTFFPVLVNSLTGFRSVDPAIIDLMNSIDASPKEVFFCVRWPSSRPFVFSALRVVAPLAMIAAVVAEWTGASSGLGRSMWLAYTNMNMPALFAGVFLLSALSTGLYASVLRIEKKSLHWKPEDR